MVSQTAEFPDSTSITVDFPRGKLRSMSARMTAKLRSVCGIKKGAKVITIIVKCHSRWTEMLRRTRWISCSSVQKEHSWMNESKNDSSHGDLQG